jgi:TrmH family RNA methyltransferase
MRSQLIQSTDNPRYKAARRLLHSRGRRQQERIAVFGVREALRAIRTGIVIDEIFLCRELLRPEQLIELDRHFVDRTTPVWEIPKHLIESLEYGERHQGLLLIAKRPATDLSRLRLPPQCLVVVLEAAEKPGNIGAVARTAVAAGADTLILASPVSDLFHPNSIRASMGSVFSLQTAIGSSLDVRDWLSSQGVSIVAARTDARQTYTSVDLRPPTAIVLGSESLGLSDLWSVASVRAARLPMSGDADSLNVSVTAAVLLYEANRQRSEKTSENRPI